MIDGGAFASFSSIVPSMFEKESQDTLYMVIFRCFVRVLNLRTLELI